MMARSTAYKPEYAAMAHLFCKEGATMADLATHFGVTERTIYNWLRTNLQFFQAVKSGCQVADQLVEHALFTRAVGYDYDERSVTTEEEQAVSTDGERVYSADGKPVPKKLVKTKTTKAKKHVVPDVTAAIFWLKNRKAAEWRDVHSIESTLKELTDDQLLARAAGITSKHQADPGGTADPGGDGPAGTDAAEAGS